MAPGLISAASGLTVASRGTLGPADLAVADVGLVRRPTGPALEARTKRGIVWRRLWIEPHRLVAEFIGYVLVEVRESDGAVVFDHLLAPDLEQHLLLDHLLPLVIARRGSTVLHGAVVHWEGRAVVVCGPSGAGKSTLTAYAWQHGWTVAGDDGAVVHPGNPPTVQATYPTIRLTPAAADLLDIVPTPESRVVGKHRITGPQGKTFVHDAASLAAVIILQPVAEGEPATLMRLRGARAHVALFGATFHVDLGQNGRLGAIVDDLADLADVLPIGVLSVPRGREGLAAALHAMQIVARG